MQRAKRYLWLSILTALAAVIVLLACWILPGYIPPAWSSARFTKVDIDYEPYLVPGSPNLNYLKCTATFDPQGDGVYASTKVTITLTDKSFPDIPAGLAVRGTREGALLRLRTGYAVACSRTGYPEAATLFSDTVLFDPTRSAPTQTATVTYPERIRVAFLMSLRPYAIVTAWCALGLGLSLTAVLSTKLFSRRKQERANCCRACGYNLAGIVTPICPECGRDAHDDRLRRARKAGRTRKAAGAVLALLGIALALLWQDSVRNRTEPVLLINHTSPSRLAGHQIFLAQGGLAVRMFDANNMRSFVATSTTDDELPEPSAHRSGVIDWSIWRYTALNSWTTQRMLWLSFWPLSLIAFSAGIWLMWSGLRAKRLANTPLPHPLPQPVKQFVRCWLITTAVVCVPALACLVFPITSTWQDCFSRTADSQLFVSIDYANNGAEAKTVSIDRTSPLLSIRTLTTAWFPSQPSLTELSPLLDRARGALGYPNPGIPSERRTMLLLPPNTPKTKLQPQPGLIILPLCALLLASPLAALAATIRSRIQRR